MTEFRAAMQSAFDFAETLPSAGTLLRPAPNKGHILAARDGVFTWAVRNAIFSMRAESDTVKAFLQKTGAIFDEEEVAPLFESVDGDTVREACHALADRCAKRYGSAENFAKHA